MLTLTFGVIAQLLLRPGDEARRLLADRRHQPVHARLDRRHRRPPGQAVLHRRSASRCSSTSSSGTSCGRRSASRSRDYATSRSGWPRSATPSPSTERSRSASCVRGIARRRALRLVGRPDLPQRSRARCDDRPAHHRRDRRARPHRGRMARRVRVHRHQQLRPRHPVPDAKGVLPWMGGSFNTVIGTRLPAIVLLSPDGLMGIWDRPASSSACRPWSPRLECRQPKRLDRA